MELASDPWGPLPALNTVKAPKEECKRREEQFLLFLEEFSGDSRDLDLSQSTAQTGNVSMCRTVLFRAVLRKESPGDDERCLPIAFRGFSRWESGRLLRSTTDNHA